MEDFFLANIEINSVNNKSSTKSTFYDSILYFSIYGFSSTNIGSVYYSLFISPYTISSIISDLNFITFYVSVPVLSLKIYSITPNSSLKFEECTAAGLSSVK